MYNRLCFSCCLLTALTFSEQSDARESCQPLIITAHPEYPPYHWRDGALITGASVELTGKILDEMGISWVSAYRGPWKRTLNAVRRGDVDMVVALKKTEEREMYMEYTSEPIFQNPFAVFVHQSSVFEYNQWSDLIGKYGGKNAGDRYGQAFDQFVKNKLTVEAAYSTDSNFQKLKKGRIDYFIHGRYVGLAHLSQRDDGHEFLVSDKNLNDGFIHSAFSKKSACLHLLPEISLRYQQMLISGEAEKILRDNIKKWAETESAR